jgi:hypothetical protein
MLWRTWGEGPNVGVLGIPHVNVASEGYVYVMISIRELKKEMPAMLTLVRLA